MRSSARSALVLVAAVTALAGGLRLWDLSAPHEKVFDEVYYASDGCWHAGLDYRECGLDADVERSWVHPPLGKQMIGWGIDLFGNRPFGWRIMPAVAGTATVALVGTLMWLLTASALWAGIAAALAATENLLFVQSRIAMLDVFLALFVVLGFVLVAADRRRSFRRSGVPAAHSAQPAADASEPPPAADAQGGEGKHEPVAPPADPVELAPAAPGARVPRIWRPLRLAAGAALGAAAAGKGSAAFARAGALLLAIASERTPRARLGERHPLRRALAEEWLGLVIAFGLVPVLVYGLAWIPWLADRSFDMAEWVKHHVEMGDYHAELESVKDGKPIHPYMSRPWTWLLLLRPVAYYYEGDALTASEIIGMGNPVVFWSSLVVLPYLALRWRRDAAAGVALVAVLAQYLPWLVVSRPLFFFYMAPVAPFLALGLAMTARDMAAKRRWLAPAAFGIVAAAVLLFAFFWPILVADTIPLESWRMRMWLRGWV